jgi:hypothetical protein
MVASYAQNRAQPGRSKKREKPASKHAVRLITEKSCAALTSDRKHAKQIANIPLTTDSAPTT